MNIVSKLKSLFEIASTVRRIRNIDADVNRLLSENSQLRDEIEKFRESSVGKLKSDSESPANSDYLIGQLSKIHTEYGSRLNFLNRTIWKIMRNQHYTGHDFDIDALNGQFSKQLIYNSLFEHLHFDQIIETGTYLGNSTKYFAKKNIPVFTVESVQRHLELAKENCHGLKNIEFIKGSSDDILNNLVSDEFSKKQNLYYLDAHWEEHIPLYREIEIIAERNSKSVVMIDDFKVPTDAGYAYDSYGSTNLDLSYISDLVQKYDLKLFFPVINADYDCCTIDIIPPRGTLVLTASEEIAAKLELITYLNNYKLY